MALVKPCSKPARDTWIGHGRRYSERRKAKAPGLNLEIATKVAGYLRINQTR